MRGRRHGRDEEHERDEADGWGASLRQLVLGEATEDNAEQFNS